MNLKKTKIELLAPCGNIDSLKAAVLNGADAVYLGGKSFGARALADNFDRKQLKEAIDFAHLWGVKVYVTVNTMVYENELVNVLGEVEYLYTIGADALIVSDLGLIYLIRKRFPDIEIHVSTQAHVHNKQAIQNLKALGVTRAVLARELDRKQIASLTSLGLDTEVFVHGALCVSYSGQCLMGSVLHGRSGNRGLCSQCCRMRYQLYDTDTKKAIKTHGKYLLSPRDLNLLKELPSLITAGMTSIKIEGRMKRSEYVALITRIYRKAIDACYENEAFSVTPKLLGDMKLLFNRGFTSGFYDDNDLKAILNPVRPNHIGIEVGRVIDQKKNKLYIKFNRDLNQGDGLRIVADDREYGIIANKIYKHDLLVNGVKGNEIAAFDYNERIPKGARVYKTTDVKLLKEINSLKPYRKIPIDIFYKTFKDQPLSIEISDGNNTVLYSGQIVNEAIKRPMSNQDIERQLRKCADSVYEVRKIHGKCDQIFIPVSQLNKARREALAMLNEERLKLKPRRVYEPASISLAKTQLPSVLIEVDSSVQLKTLLRFKKLDALYISNNLSLVTEYPFVHYLNSNVNEEGEYNDLKDQVCSELGGLQFGNIAYSTLNIANSAGCEYLMSIGYKALILSLETSDALANALIDEFYKKHGFKPNVYIYTYGKRDLMHFKKGIIYNELADLDIDHHFELVDMKGEHYRLIKYKNKTVLRETKTELLKRAHSGNHFLRFTDEGEAKTREIMTEFLKSCTTKV